MKKLYFIIAMLLSFTGMAQTVGQLRYDTVKMYKVGGSTELIIQNTTKDSTGGIFTNIGNGWGKWLKPYAISGGIVIGLDTVLVSGGGTTTEDTLLLGRGIAKDSLAPYKNSIYLDSSIYKVTQLNDSTLEFAHYDGRKDTILIASAGGGGGGGGAQGLNANTLVDSTTEQGIKIATDTAVSLGQATLFADSWGAAYGLPNPDLGWFNLVCNWYGWEINNASLSSSTLMDRVIVDPFGATNMVDRIPLIPYYNTGANVPGSKLLFAYGLNDVRWNGANYTTANFITDYTTVLDSCVARGWSGSDIILISTGYLSPTSYVSYGGNPAATQTRQLQFDSCINVLATTYGAKYYDAYTFMYNNGGNALLQTDSIHPNTQGHKVYALGFIQNYNEPVRFGAQKLAVNGLAEFNNMKFTDFPTTSNENVYEVVLDSAGYLAVSTVQHVIYNEYGNVPIGFNAVDTPYKLAVDGSAFIGDGLNIVNSNATSHNKWLQLFSDYSTGASAIDSYNPTGSAGTQLHLNGNSKGNIKMSFLGTGASTIASGNIVIDSFYSRIMHGVITGYAPARVQGGNLMYFTGNGTIISSNSAASTFDNLSLQGFGGNTNVGKNGSATARLHIDAGTATASTAPLKFNAGTNLTTPEAGAVEWDGTNLYITQTTGPTRKTLAYTTDLGSYLPLAGGTLTGNLLFTDNTYDIGASGATRPRTGYFGTSLMSPTIVGGTTTTSPLTLYATTGVAAAGASVIFKGGTNGGTTFTTMNYLGNWDFGSGTITSTGNFTGFNWLGSGFVRAAASSYIGWNGRAVFYSSADGVIDARNNGNSAYASLQTLYHRFGSGSPEGVVTAPVGCIYSRTDGGAGTSLYVKESGTGNTGWVAK